MEPKEARTLERGISPRDDTLMHNDGDAVRFAEAGDKWLEDNEIGLLEAFDRLETDHSAVIIVVEGIHDERVLRELGVTRPILRVHQGEPRLRLVERIVSAATDDTEVLILTDFDSSGEELCKYLDEQLEIHKIRTLRRVRANIHRLMANMTNIEQLSTIIKKRENMRPLQPRGRHRRRPD